MKTGDGGQRVVSSGNSKANNESFDWLLGSGQFTGRGGWVVRGGHATPRGEGDALPVTEERPDSAKVLLD